MSPQQLVVFLQHNGIDCAKWISFDRQTKRGIVNGWLGRRYPSPDAGPPLPQDSINNRFVSVFGFVGVAGQSQQSVNLVISRIDEVIAQLDNACARAAWNAAYGPQPASTGIHAKATPTGASPFAPVRQLPAGQVTVNTTPSTPYLGYMVAAALGAVGGYVLRSKKKLI